MTDKHNAQATLLTVEARQRYKVAALQGLLAFPSEDSPINAKRLADTVGELADAMLAEDAEFLARRLELKP